MTSSNGNIFRVTGPLCSEFTDPRWIPFTKASDAELIDLRLNKQLNKQSQGWWFETLSRSLWRHCNECVHDCLTYGPMYESYAEFNTAPQANFACQDVRSILFLVMKSRGRNPGLLLWILPNNTVNRQVGCLQKQYILYVMLGDVISDKSKFETE